MKNSHETGWALLLLGAALLLVQTLPARYWPDNARLLAIFSLPGERGGGRRGIGVARVAGSQCSDPYGASRSPTAAGSAAALISIAVYRS